MTTSPPLVKHDIKIRLFDPPAARAQDRPKIVLLKLGERIGDFLVAVEAFRIIRNAFAGAEITLICLPSIVALAESTSLFDRVAGYSHVLDVMNEKAVPKMDSDEQIAAFKAVLDGPYLFAADFRYDGSTRLWLDHIETSYRAGFAAPMEKGLDILLPAAEWDVPTTSFAHKNLPIHAETRLTLLAHAIVESLLEKSLDADLFHLGQDMDKLPAYRALADDPRLKIGLSLGAGSELRQWPAPYWAALLPKIATARNALFVFFGGPGDKAETAVLTAQLPPGSFTDLVGAFPLTHVPAYMDLLDAYIGCDTGLTHLAGNLGVPTVNIFAGISNVSVWRARGPKVKTVYAEVICAPCHLRFKEDCPNRNICMGAIVPDIVYACFEQVIAPG